MIENKQYCSNKDFLAKSQLYNYSILYNVTDKIVAFATIYTDIVSYTFASTDLDNRIDKKKLLNIHHDFYFEYNSYKYIFRITYHYITKNYLYSLYSPTKVILGNNRFITFTNLNDYELFLSLLNDKVFIEKYCLIREFINEYI